MEEVDRLILNVLRELNCSGVDEDEDISSLKQLSIECIFEGIVLCLRRINVAQPLPVSFKLPPQMTSRYRNATLVADAIKASGFKGDIGYQTLLYGSEGDTRRLFIHLIDLLPKDVCAPTEAAETSSVERLRTNGAEEIRRSLNSPWVPWFCRRQRLKWDGRLWCCPTDSETVPFTAYNSMWDSNGAIIPYRHIPATIIDRVGTSAIAERTWSSEETLVKLQHALAESTSQRLAKPKLLPKPVLSQDITEKTSPTTDVEEVQNVERQRLENEMSTLVESLENQKQLLSDTRSQNAQTQAEIKQIESKRTILEGSQKRKHDAFIKTEKRYSALLHDPETSGEKLRAFLEQAEDRLQKLESQWANHRIPKQKELADAKANALLVGGVNSLVVKLEEMRQREEDLTDELTTKQEFADYLHGEHAKMPNKNLSRSAYTKRILEIVASVRKQRQEIDKVIEENRILQKASNLQQGNLERSFIAAEERLYKGAVGDAALQKAYQMLVAVHTQCGDLVSTVEQTGHLQREVEELHDQIETESQKATDANLGRLVNDFCDVRSENELMEEKIRLLSSTKQ